MMQVTTSWILVVCVLMPSGVGSAAAATNDPLSHEEQFHARCLKEFDANNDGIFEMADVAARAPHLDVRSVEGKHPQQVHLSFVESTGNMTQDVMVMWVTGEKITKSMVKYGQRSKSWDLNATGSVHTYTAGGWKGEIHQVRLPNLPYATKFHYIVGGDDHFSKEFSFTTPPKTGEIVEQVFAMYGDMGTAIPAGWDVCLHMEHDNKKIPFNAMLHLGDISYASTKYYANQSLAALAESVQDSDGDGELELVWDVWARMVEPLAANIPYVAAVGNHEKFYNFSSYLARFRNPLPWGGSPAKIEEAKFWFSIDYGLVHFVFMSTEHSYDIGSDQYNWLVQDLTAADAARATTPWIILTGHRPMYSSDQSEKDQHWPGAHFQQTIEPLLAQYSVNLYVCGHMHMYERIHPVKDGVTLQTGSYYNKPAMPPQVVQGTAGVFEDQKFVVPLPDWSAYREGSLGYGRVTVMNATHLYYEFRKMKTRTTEDSFWLTNSAIP